MTEKFKFGDLVEVKGYEGLKAVILSENTSNGEYPVYIGSDIDEIFHFPTEELTKLPHPDTRRLEYMGKLVAESMGMKYDAAEHRRQIDESMIATMAD